MKKITPLIFKTFISFALFTSVFATAQGSGLLEASKNTGGWAVKEPFSNKVFVENNGQFTTELKTGEAIVYAYSNFNQHIYFTASGPVYHLQQKDLKENDKHGIEEFKEAGEEIFHKYGVVDEDKIAKYFNDKSAMVYVQFEGANTNTTIEAVDQLKDYYTYSKVVGNAYAHVQASAFKKIIYRNIYPNIDVEYYFPTDKKEGFKYNIIVNPGGDISKVKMKYSGQDKLKLDNNGNLLITVPSGDIIDHAPVSFVGGGTEEIVSNFVLNNNSVSFNIPTYDHSKTLIVDPWVVNPGFTTSNKGYGIRVDYSGNCYVYGGGAPGFGNSVYQVKKYNNAGVLQWTYSTPSMSLGFYGDITCDRLGNSFIGAAFGYTGGNMILKLSPAGAVIAQMAAYTPPGPGPSFEVWRLVYNQAANNPVLYIGGGGSPGVQNGLINSNLTGTPRCTTLI